MEQDVFFGVGEFDRSKVDLSKTPTTAVEYLKQVAMDREKCPVTLRASNLNSTKFVPASNQIPPDPSSGCICPLAPNKEWSLEMVGPRIY